MRVIDPIPFMGLDSGLRRVAVSARDAATLRAAAAIADRAHDLLVSELGDGHYDLPDNADLCTAGDSLRRLADGEVEW